MSSDPRKIQKLLKLLQNSTINVVVMVDVVMWVDIIIIISSSSSSSSSNNNNNNKSTSCGNSLSSSHHRYHRCHHHYKRHDSLVVFVICFMFTAMRPYCLSSAILLA